MACFNLEMPALYLPLSLFDLDAHLHPGLLRIYYFKISLEG